MLDEKYVEGLMEGHLERDGEWEEGEMALEILKAGCEVLPGRPERSG